MKKIFFLVALLALASGASAQLRFAPDFSQAGVRSGWQSVPVMEGHMNVSILTLGLRAQIADAFVSHIVGLDLGKPFRLEGPGGWVWSPVAHGYGAIQGLGYRVGVNAQVAHWDNNGLSMWNGVDVTLYYADDPALGRSVGFVAGINLNARPALTWLKIQEIKTLRPAGVHRYEHR